MATLREQSSQSACVLREQAVRDLDAVRHGLVDTVTGAIEFGFGATKNPTRSIAAAKNAITKYAALKAGIPS